MQKAIEVLSRFLPVFAAYPKWMQFFFFAVLLQVFALLFLMLFHYLTELKPSKSAVLKAQNSTVALPEPTSGTHPIVTEDNRELSKGFDLEAIQKSSDPNLALSLSNLAALYIAQGQYTKAKEILSQVLAIQERAFSRNHPQYATSLQNLASLLVDMGIYEEAVEAQKEAVQICITVLGRSHPNTATALNHLAAIYLKLARYEEAAPLVDEALRIRRSALGPEHPDILPVLENLLVIYKNAGNVQKANAIADEIEKLKEKFGLSTVQK